MAEPARYANARYTRQSPLAHPEIPRAPDHGFGGSDAPIWGDVDGGAFERAPAVQMVERRSVLLPSASDGSGRAGLLGGSIDRIATSFAQAAPPVIPTLTARPGLFEKS